jgi:hypothetical protein
MRFIKIYAPQTVLDELAELCTTANYEFKLGEKAKKGLGLDEVKKILRTILNGTWYSASEYTNLIEGKSSYSTVKRALDELVRDKEAEDRKREHGVVEFRASQQLDIEGPIQSKLAAIFNKGKAA